MNINNKIYKYVYVLCYNNIVLVVIHYDGVHSFISHSLTLPDTMAQYLLFRCNFAYRNQITLHVKCEIGGRDDVPIYGYSTPLTVCVFAVTPTHS